MSKKIEWTIYPVAFDDEVEEYTNSAVSMTPRLYFGGRTFPSFRAAYAEAVTRVDSFYIGAELPEEVAMELRDPQVASSFAEANDIPPEIIAPEAIWLDVSSAEFERLFLGVGSSF